MKDFYDWFIKNLWHYGRYTPSSKWLERVESCHDEIRSLIGGKEKTIAVDFQNHQVPLKDETALYYSRKINDILGSIDGRIRGFSSSELVTPKVKYKRKIYKNIEKKNGSCYHDISLGKCIEHEFKKYDITSSKRHLVSKLLSDLGKEWAKNNLKEYKIYVTISTTPKAFALLGHYIPNSKSCFAHNSCNYIHKFTLGATTNSYVVVVTSKDQPIDGPVENNIARCWGIPHVDLQGLNLNNYYTAHGSLDGNVNQAIEQLFKNILGEISIYKNKIIDVEGVYFNKKGPMLLTFCKKNAKEPTSGKMISNRHNYEGHQCISCKDFVEAPDIINGTCKECLKKI